MWRYTAALAAVPAYSIQPKSTPKHSRLGNPGQSDESSFTDNANRCADKLPKPNNYYDYYYHHHHHHHHQ
eukprot:14358937-Heterocapsa_arctica.AAC.1